MGLADTVLLSFAEELSELVSFEVLDLPKVADTSATGAVPFVFDSELFFCEPSLVELVSLLAMESLIATAASAAETVRFNFTWSLIAEAVPLRIVAAPVAKALMIDFAPLLFELVIFVAEELLEFVATASGDAVVFVFSRSFSALVLLMIAISPAAEVAPTADTVLLKFARYSMDPISLAADAALESAVAATDDVVRFDLLRSLLEVALLRGAELSRTVVALATETVLFNFFWSFLELVLKALEIGDKAVLLNFVLLVLELVASCPLTMSVAEAVPFDVKCSLFETRESSNDTFEKTAPNASVQLADALMLAASAAGATKCALTKLCARS